VLEVLVARSLGWSVCAVLGRGITAPVEVVGRDPGCAGGGEEMYLADVAVSCEGEWRSAGILPPLAAW
jgi:hypothetical protein